MVYSDKNRNSACIADIKEKVMPFLPLEDVVAPASCRRCRCLVVVKCGTGLFQIFGVLFCLC